MGSKAPKAPDLGPLAQSSAEAAKVAQETAMAQLDWAKQQDSMNRELLTRVLGSQEQVQNETLKNAQRDRQRYEQIYQPLEDNLTKEFQNYGSPQRMDQERGRAIADVNTQFDAARRNALQRLESFGVDPSQTRNQALDLGTRVQQAAAQASAATNATRNVENTGRALRAEALNIGKGYPSNVAGSYGQSLAAGNSQISGANQTTATSAGALQGANSFMNTAQQGYGNAANIQSQGYQNQLGQYGANQANITGALGAIGGVAGMFMADGGTPEQRRRGITIDHDTGMIDEGPSDGTGIDDQVPINASVGEYIIPADVVRIKGEEFFDRIVEKYHKPADEQRQELPQRSQNDTRNYRRATPNVNQRRMAIA